MALGLSLLAGCGAEQSGTEGDTTEKTGALTTDVGTFPAGSLRLENARPGLDYVANEIVVGFKPELFSVRANNPGELSLAAMKTLHAELQAGAAKLAQELGYELRDTSPVVPVALMRLPAATTPLMAIARLQGDPRLAFVEANALRQVAATIPTDPGYINQKGHLTDVGAQRAWDTVPLDDYVVRIAVLDTGFHFEHPDKWYDVSNTEDRDFVSLGTTYLACPNLPVPGDWDGIGYDADATQLMDMDYPALPAACPFLVPQANGSHGSRVAGIIASEWNNGAGGVGVLGRLHQVTTSSHSTIIPIQVLDVTGRGRSYDIMQGILYAGGLPASDGQNGLVVMPRADIANMSFAGYLPTFQEMAAVALANVSGVLLIAAVGNNANALPTFPAWWPQVLSVSALDQNENLASFSSWGKVDLTAPGVSVYATSYDYSGCIPIFGFPCLGVTGGVPGYSTGQGTSFAAPHVAGIAALYKAHDDFLTNNQLRTMLLASAADWGAPGPDVFFGSGLVQAAPGRGVGLVADRGATSAYLVNSTTGAVISTSVDAATRDYQFLNVPAGSYYLLAARDADGDGKYGETAEAIGAAGGGGGGALQLAPTRWVPAGTVNGSLNFPLDWPGVEPEPANNSSAGAGATFVGFYVEAAYSAAADVDWFQFRVPSDGNYRIWTEGRNTIECREVFNEMNPAISLYASTAGLPIATDSNSGEGDCAELPAQWLVAGIKYYISVTSEGIAPAVGDATILHIDGP